MTKKLKDINPQKTERLSNQLTVLRADTKKVLSSAFKVITKRGNDIDEQELLMRDSIYDLKVYQIDNFATDKADVKEEKENIFSHETIINECYEFINQDKKDFRDTYIHKSFSIVAKTVIMLINAKLYSDEHRLGIHKGSAFVSQTKKDKKTYRLHDSDLFVEYNYLKPTLTSYDKTLKQTVSEINDDDTKIPLNKEGVKKIYNALYSTKKDLGDLDTPNAIDSIDGFNKYVNQVSDQFALWSNEDNKNLQADYNNNAAMKKTLNNLTDMIKKFKDNANLLLTEDHPTESELKRMGESSFNNDKKQVNQK